MTPIPRLTLRAKPRPDSRRDRMVRLEALLTLADARAAVSIIPFRGPTPRLEPARTQATLLGEAAHAVFQVHRNPPRGQTRFAWRPVAQGFVR